MSTSPVDGDDRRRGRGQFRVDGARIAAGGVVPLATARLGADVAAEHADRADEQAAQLAREIALAVGRLAELVECRHDERPHPCLERFGRVLVDDPAEAAQRDDDRLPDRVIALVRGSRRGTRAVRPPTAARRASTTRRRRRGCTARACVIDASTSPASRCAEFLGVGDAVEAVAAGVDDHRPVRIGERDRLGQRRARRGAPTW